jgi:hypothetical protein
MSDTQTSNRVVDLSEYRAARAALKRGAVAAAAPYLLWYPGFGYVEVRPTFSSRATTDLFLGKNYPSA